MALQLGDDMSIFEVKDTVCISGSIGIVRYHGGIVVPQSMIDLFQVQ